MFKKYRQRRKAIEKANSCNHTYIEFTGPMGETLNFCNKCGLNKELGFYMDINKEGLECLKNTDKEEKQKKL